MVRTRLSDEACSYNPHMIKSKRAQIFEWKYWGQEWVTIDCSYLLHMIRCKIAQSCKWKYQDIINSVSVQVSPEEILSYPYVVSKAKDDMTNIKQKTVKLLMKQLSDNELFKINKKLQGYCSNKIVKLLLSKKGKKTRIWNLGRSLPERTSSLSWPLAWICFTSIRYISTHQ